MQQGVMIYTCYFCSSRHAPSNTNSILNFHFFTFMREVQNSSRFLAQTHYYGNGVFVLKILNHIEDLGNAKKTTIKYCFKYGERLPTRSSLVETTTPYG